MPPNLDIYGLTKYRNVDIINHFLDKYVDRQASDKREDEDLMLVPLGRTKDTTKYLWPQVHEYHLEHDQAYREQYYEYDWEPAENLANIVKRGLDYPRRSFTVYLTPKQEDIQRAILSFTVDNQLILGLSIDDEMELAENKERARRLLSELAEQYRCHLGVIFVEHPPPINEDQFRDMEQNRQNYPLLIAYTAFT
ncbi:MAG TPA: hypothetical protein VM409_02320 [Chloroflexia bacterium]|nr:hypothetical protein [Chloroflexia bacterium]